MALKTSQTPGRRITLPGGMELALPNNEKGLGNLIQAPDSQGLIDGVRVQPFAVFPDDRGYFLEVHRMGRGLAAGFPASSTQISAAFNYPGTVKAFHYHLQQTDCWVPARGLFQVGLADLRVGSPTFGLRNTLYLGPIRPWQLLIPPGVAHGYKIVGEEAAMLVYLTDKFYNPDDEGRIAHNDPGINYDWETQRK